MVASFCRVGLCPSARVATILGIPLLVSSISSSLILSTNLYMSTVCWPFWLEVRSPILNFLSELGLIVKNSPFSFPGVGATVSSVKSYFLPLNTVTFFSERNKKLFVYQLLRYPVPVLFLNSME